MSGRVLVMKGWWSCGYRGDNGTGGDGVERGNSVAGVVVHDSGKKALGLWACSSGRALQRAALSSGQQEEEK